MCAVATPAAAHVSIDPPSAPQGSTVKLSFIVPNEEDSRNGHQGADRVPDAARHADSRSLRRAEARMEIDGHEERLAEPIETDDGSISEVVSLIDWVALTPATR